MHVKNHLVTSFSCDTGRTCKLIIVILTVIVRVDVRSCHPSIPVVPTCACFDFHRRPMETWRQRWCVSSGDETSQETSTPSQTATQVSMKPKTTLLFLSSLAESRCKMTWLWPNSSSSLNSQWQCEPREKRAVWTMGSAIGQDVPIAHHSPFIIGIMGFIRFFNVAWWNGTEQPFCTGHNQHRSRVTAVGGGHDLRPTPVGGFGRCFLIGSEKENSDC